MAVRIAKLDADARGRLVLGLGVSHGPMVPQYAKPYSAMVSCLDALDSATSPVDPGHRVPAALGPKMLKLAAGRALGAHPYLVTTQHTAEAREALGPDALLAPELSVVLDTDLDRARGTSCRRRFRRRSRRSPSSPPPRTSSTGRCARRRPGPGGKAGISRTFRGPEHPFVRPGQRISVTRCSVRAAQLELSTDTYTLAMLPPQLTQWPLP